MNHPKLDYNNFTTPSAKDFDMYRLFLGFFQDFEGRRGRSAMVKKEKYFEGGTKILEKSYKKKFIHIEILDKNCIIRSSCCGLSTFVTVQKLNLN